MTEQRNKYEQDELDRLMSRDLLAVPADFRQRVQALVEAYSEPEANVGPARRPLTSVFVTSRLRELIEWAAVSTAVLIGLPRLAGFLFAVWMTGAAG